MEIDKNLNLAFDLDDSLRESLYYASLAPSGHNTQPWIADVSVPGEIAVILDSSRTLNEVDPKLRETCISIGAFVENLLQALEAYGHNVSTSVEAGIDLAKPNPIVAKVGYGVSGGDVSSEKLVLIEKRHTDKSNYLDEALSLAALENLTGNIRGLHYYAKDSAPFAYLRDGSYAANAIQASGLAKRKELAEWLRFSDKEAREKADGLPAEQLGLRGIVKALYYLTVNRENAQTDKFARQSLSLAERQLNNCAGFFVLTGGTEPQAWVETGMRMEKFWLAAAGLGISLQPVSQMLEEEPWAGKIDAALGLDAAAQMIFRAGYVKKYGRNNKIRRPIGSFTVN